MQRDVFGAIADPTRREILGMISRQSLNVNSVTENFGVSRTAIYKHLKILTECGLVVFKHKGRERYCEAKLDRLGEVSEWIEQYRKFWSVRFANLDKYLEKQVAVSKKENTIRVNGRNKPKAKVKK